MRKEKAAHRERITNSIRDKIKTLEGTRRFSFNFLESVMEIVHILKVSLFFFLLTPVPIRFVSLLGTVYKEKRSTKLSEVLFLKGRLEDKATQCPNCSHQPHWEQNPKVYTVGSAIYY